jgi:hypothetical protein
MRIINNSDPKIGLHNHDLSNTKNGIIFSLGNKNRNFFFLGLNHRCYYSI